MISKTIKKHIICKSNIETKVIKSIGKNGEEHIRKTKKLNIYFDEPNFRQEASNVLFTACMKYLFGFDNRSTLDDYLNLFITRIKHYASTEFLDKVKDVSVLSLLIFCAYNRYNLLERLDAIKESDKYKGSVKKYTKENLIENNTYPDFIEDDFVLANAQDMAEGLLQLIENTVFHAGTPDQHNGFGVLSIRIFKKGQQSKESYLNSTYKCYFEGHDNRSRIDYLTNQETLEDYSSFDRFIRYGDKSANKLSQTELDRLKENLKEIEIRKSERASSSYHLEVRLSDNSGKNMCKVFLSNHRNDDKPCPFNDSLEYKMEISSFFSPNVLEREKWRIFNKESDNVIHHYGLQLFDAMLQSIDGCFLVQSVADGEIPDKKSFLLNKWRHVRIY